MTYPVLTSSLLQSNRPESLAVCDPGIKVIDGVLDIYIAEVGG